MHTDKQLVFCPLLNIPAITAIRWVCVLFRKCIHGINPTPPHTPKFLLNSAANSYLRKRPVFSTNISTQTHIIARVNTTGKSAFSTPTEWPTHSWGNPLKWHMTSLQRHLSPRPLPSLPDRARIQVPCWTHTASQPHLKSFCFTEMTLCGFLSVLHIPTAVATFLEIAWKAH